MQSKMASILRAANRRPGDRLNVISFTTHEGWQSSFENINADFYLIEDFGIRGWNTSFRPFPKNHFIVDRHLPHDLEFDLVLSQERYKQYPVARHIADDWQLPLISLEHCLPKPEWGTSFLEKEKSSLRADLFVFVSENGRKLWGYDSSCPVVHHGVDTNLFKPEPYIDKMPVCLSVVQKWKERDWACGFSFWQEVIAAGDIPICVLGDNPGLSTPAKDVNELVHHYQNCQLFLNTTTASSLPVALLEAMSCGACVLSRPTSMIGSLIHNGFNGFLCNTPAEMRTMARYLLTNPARCAEVGANARQTILDHFSNERFVDDWTKIFWEALQAS